MSKYEPLTRYLESLPQESWDARFGEVEKVLGFSLPPSAHRYQAWWANQEAGHSQTKGWREAGFETSNVDLVAKRVRFERRRRKSRASTANRSQLVDPSMSELWDRARRLSGIENREKLIEAALTALIRREAAKGLIALGGTMPDASAPPRERPFA
ncbi:MAG TPA: hypothetical protein VEC60_00420 [Reyranella sp.]|nr:hypothetical protein [Reyranella sp.]